MNGEGHVFHRCLLPCLAVLGVIMMFSLFGCGAAKYRLNLDGGLESKKTSYAAGERVTVYYGMIATDTDYSFSSEDVELEQSYDDDHGYVLEFVMPDHDVTINVDSRNTMMYDPNAFAGTDPQAAELFFDSFDGGGPSFTAKADEEGIVTWDQSRSYPDPDHGEKEGSSYTVLFLFYGLRPGETQVVIEERSPITENVDHRYRVTVDGDLNVSIEELESESRPEGQPDMRLYIDGLDVPVVWNDNEAAEELRALVPLTLKLSKYSDFEQVGSIGSVLTSEDERITTDPGDIMLYNSDQIVLFYGSNTWEYTRLGFIDLTEEELRALLGNGDVEITIE